MQRIAKGVLIAQPEEQTLVKTAGGRPINKQKHMIIEQQEEQKHVQPARGCPINKQKCRETLKECLFAIQKLKTCTIS